MSSNKLKDYSKVYVDLPTLKDGYSYYRLSEMAKDLQSIECPQVYADMVDYGVSEIRYIRPTFLFRDYIKCDIDYEAIPKAPFTNGLYSVSSELSGLRTPNVHYLGNIYDAIGNGAFAVFSDECIKVGRISGMPIDREIHVGSTIAHFSSKANGIASTDYILRELTADYVLKQTQLMEKYFGTVTRHDLFQLMIAVPPMDVQDAILLSEKAMSTETESIFEVIETYFDEAVQQDSIRHLRDILRAAKGENDIDSKLYFNSIRQILEWLFKAANKLGFLHDDCLNHQGRNKINLNISDSIRFMEGKKTKYSNGVRCTKAHFPELLAKNVWSLYTVTSEGSHASEILTEYLNMLNSPNLLYSLVYLLMDVLIWFGKYAKEHPNPDENRALWIKIKRNVIR